MRYPARIRPVSPGRPAPATGRNQANHPGKEDSLRPPSEQRCGQWPDKHRRGCPRPPRPIASAPARPTVREPYEKESYSAPRERGGHGLHDSGRDTRQGRKINRSRGECGEAKAAPTLRYQPPCGRPIRSGIALFPGRGWKWRRFDPMKISRSQSARRSRLPSVGSVSSVPSCGQR